MKKIICGCLLLWCSVSYSQITIQATVKGYGNSIIIGYFKDFNYVSDTLRLKNNLASYKFNSAGPVYFKLQTINPDSYTPFLMAFPGETIAIKKDIDHLTISGGAESYNRFLIAADSAIKVDFSRKRVDNNTITKYLLDRSDAFFSSFEHPDKAMIMDIYNLHVITNYKFYSLMIKYANDTSKINSLTKFIRNKESVKPSEVDLLKYIDKVDFDNPNIGFANISDVMMMNNLVRILRTQAIKKDSTLKNFDEYTLESVIIKNLFKESRYRSRLLAYNLYDRIESYTKYPMQLAEVGNFIAAFSKEKFSDDLVPVIEKLYKQQLVTVGSLAKGELAPYFKLPDVKGKMVYLSAFKGKVVYLDMWATWCGPCLKEMPYMETLREKYKDKAVELIAISIDTDIKKWLAKIAAMSLKGIQLIDSKGSENSKITKDYKIHGVPHYILIDKNGRIASAFAPRPSSGADIEKAIDQLLQ